MNPLLTTGTVTMTRNVGTHWLITLALAATLGEGVELSAGNEITLSAEAGSEIPAQGSTLSLRIEPRSGFAEPVAQVSGGSGIALVEFNDAEASKAAAVADLKRHFAESMDETRAFYENELAGLKAALGDKDRQLADVMAELGSERAARAAAEDQFTKLAAEMNEAIAGHAAALAALTHPPAPLEEPPASDAGTAPLQPAGPPPSDLPASDPVDLEAAGLPAEVAPPPHSDPAPIAASPAN